MRLEPQASPACGNVARTPARAIVRHSRQAPQAGQPAGVGQALGGALQQHIAQTLQLVLKDLQQHMAQSVRQQMEQELEPVRQELHKQVDQALEPVREELHK